MTAAELLAVFKERDEAELAEQHAIAKLRAERRRTTEAALLTILRNRADDGAWHVWPGGKRPRFCYDGNNNSINFDGNQVVLRSCGNRETFATLEEVADRVRKTR